jgi:multicomponent Na+:H+ antiporter subunit B
MIALLLLFSLFLLLRGHHEPGGGFVGGLVASAAFSLHAIAHRPAETRRLLRVEPETLLALGLAVAVCSGLPGVVAGRPFLTGLWLEAWGHAAGTPLVFDVGVYLVVCGVCLSIILSLAEE